MSNNFNLQNSEITKKIPLSCAEIGKSYNIVKCTLPTELRSRLFDLGLVPKTKVCFLKRAPLGDPMEISVRGYSLCIRASVARQFLVEEN